MRTIPLLAYAYKNILQVLISTKKKVSTRILRVETCWLLDAHFLGNALLFFGKVFHFTVRQRMNPPPSSSEVSLVLHETVSPSRPFETGSEVRHVIRHLPTKMRSPGRAITKRDFHDLILNKSFLHNVPLYLVWYDEAFIIQNKILYIIYNLSNPIATPYIFCYSPSYSCTA